MPSDKANEYKKQTTLESGNQDFDDEDQKDISSKKLFLSEIKTKFKPELLLKKN